MYRTFSKFFLQMAILFFPTCWGLDLSFASHGTRDTRSQWHRCKLGTTKCDGKAMCCGFVWFGMLMTRWGNAKDAVAEEMLSCSWDMARISTLVSAHSVEIWWNMVPSHCESRKWSSVTIFFFFLWDPCWDLDSQRILASTGWRSIPGLGPVLGRLRGGLGDAWKIAGDTCYI